MIVEQCRDPVEINHFAQVLREVAEKRGKVAIRSYGFRNLQQRLILLDPHFIALSLSLQTHMILSDDNFDRYSAGKGRRIIAHANRSSANSISAVNGGVKQADQPPIFGPRGVASEVYDISLVNRVHPASA